MIRPRAPACAASTLDLAHQRAFSLLELLVVMTIMIIMVGLLAIGTDTSRAMRLAANAQSVQKAILQARLEATSRNRPVEVRFCRTNSQSPVQTVQLAVYHLDGHVEVPMKPVKLHETVLIETDPTRNTLFQENNAANNATGTEFAANDLPGITLPDVGSDYEVFSIFVRPDGSTSLPWAHSTFPFLTVRLNRKLDETPANFVTIQIDPVTAQPSIFQP